MRIIIIGAGPGGYETAAEAASRGIETILISEGPLGGTCLNEGCIPTKALCAMDAPDQERKEAVISQLQAGIAQLMRHKLITLVDGRAKLISPRSVEAAGTVYEADAIIIATGSMSASLPIPGAGLAIDSSAMLNLQEVPQRLCVIGGGVIGLEFASVYSKFGSEVTVLEFCPGILPRFDTDLAKRLKASLVKRGITIETSARVTSITEGKVHWTKGDKEFDTEADCILMAVGHQLHAPRHRGGCKHADQRARSLCCRRHHRRNDAGPCGVSPGAQGPEPHLRHPRRNRLLSGAGGGFHRAGGCLRRQDRRRVRRD